MARRVGTRVSEKEDNVNSLNVFSLDLFDDLSPNPSKNSILYFSKSQTFKSFRKYITFIKVWISKNKNKKKDRDDIQDCENQIFFPELYCNTLYSFQMPGDNYFL